MSAGWTVPSRAAVGGGTFDPLLDADTFGADATLSKPLSDQQLFGVIHRLLDVNVRG
jgi:hypothetical protein